MKRKMHMLLKTEPYRNRKLEHLPAERPQPNNAKVGRVVRI